MLESYKLCIDDITKLSKEVRKTILDLEHVREFGINKLRNTEADPTDF